MKDGIILIDKEPGVTSRKIDNEIGHLFNTKKVGHLGTLDPFASGLLVVAINKGTKFLPYLDDEKKTYLALLKLGVATSTGDIDGEVMETKDIPVLDMGQIKECLTSFLGEGEQLPPMTSAIKINGVPLYKKAHKGEEIDRNPRKIHVYSLECLSYLNGELLFSCTVSKGTYIRTLGEDIAKKLGTVGHLEKLSRLAVGDIKVKDAKKISEISEDDILDPTPFLNRFKNIELDEEEAARVRNGLSYSLPFDGGETIILCHNKVAIAAYKKDHKHDGKTVYIPERGLF